MNRDKILTAIQEDKPFLINMADGEKYKVAERNQIALGRAYVIFVGKDDMPRLLQMSKMAGISYLKSAK